MERPQAGVVRPGAEDQGDQRSARGHGVGVEGGEGSRGGRARGVEERAEEGRRGGDQREDRKGRRKGRPRVIRFDSVRFDRRLEALWRDAIGRLEESIRSIAHEADIRSRSTVGLLFVTRSLA